MNSLAIIPNKINNYSKFNTKIAEKPQVAFKGYEDDDDDKQISKKKAAAITAAAALSAATLAGISCYKINRLRVGRLTAELDSLRGIRSEVEELTAKNKNLDKINKNLKKEVENARDKFRDIFESDLSPKDIREKLFKELKTKIDSSDYGYDITTPPVTGKKVPDSGKSGGVPLPNSVSTGNRVNMKELKIPEISSDGRFYLEIPTSSEMKITRMDSVNFTPVKNQLTNISEDYADSVQWNNDKIARDLMQNFFDGHGQTLDGVVMKFEPAGNGKFKVRIEGKSTFTPDKAAYIGESTKRGNLKAAGERGEGVKMATLKLLKDKGTNNVKIASDNWKLTYGLEKGNLSDKRVLAYSLDKVDKYEGNYIEFVTSDKNFLETLKNTVKRFYHSSNRHFKCPDFENELFGITNLPKGQKGGIYVAGQRIEFNGDYDGLDDIAIFLKEKPPADVLDLSRDRISLNVSNLESIASWLAFKCRNRMPSSDKLKLLKSLENYWDATDNSPMAKFVKKFADWANLSGTDVLRINFPEKYVAYSMATPEVVMDLQTKGYKVCHKEFAELGMQTIKDLYGDARAHDVVIPNNTQKKKIIILKEALRKLAPSLENEHFSPQELDAKIYMFDRFSSRERDLYSNAVAEAIVDKGSSKGFWIDKNYLSTASFHDALETALHELSHKAGGDESSAFSYKLTNVNASAIGQMVNDATCRNELQMLNKLWNSL